MSVDTPRSYTQPESRLEAAELLRRIGLELEALARLSLRIERSLSEIELPEHLPVGIVRELQGIDRISQSLGELAILLCTVSAETPSEATFSRSELFSRLRLKELINNLDPAHCDALAKRDSDGEIQWL